MKAHPDVANAEQPRSPVLRDLMQTAAVAHQRLKEAETRAAESEQRLDAVLSLLQWWRANKPNSPAHDLIAAINEGLHQ